MKKVVFAAIASAFVSASASAFAAPAPHARFDGICAGANISVSGIEIGYQNLNLDLDETAGKIANAECTITTTLPAQRGFRIIASDFKLRADALVNPNGLASIFVAHRFNGQDVNGVSAITRAPGGPLTAQQAAISTGGCHQPVELRTKLTVKAKYATVLQQDALARVVSYKLQYVPCN